jgi:hypothetical protein
MIIYHLGRFHFRSFDRKMMRKVSKAMAALPFRPVSFHHCLSDKRYRFVISFAMRLLAWEVRAKFKVHNLGPPTEAAFSLMTYGIPADLIPVGADGEIKRRNHLEWIKYRKTLEEYETSGAVDWIEIPNNTDVLFGKGRTIQQHIGNMRLHALVEERLEEYSACGSRKEKKEISEGIVAQVKEASGRFLTQESGVWIEANGDVAREKVTHLFRNRRNVSKSKKKEGKDTGVVRPGISGSSRAHVSDVDENGASGGGAAKRVRVG